MSNTKAKLRSLMREDLGFYSNLPFILALNAFTAAYLFTFLRSVLSHDAYSFDLLGSLTSSFMWGFMFAGIAFAFGKLISEQLQDSKLNHLKVERKKRTQRVKQALREKIELLEKLQDGDSE